MLRASFQSFALRIVIGGAALQILRNLLGHQIAVLIAALVGLPFDVQIDPAALRIAVRRAVGLDGGLHRPGVVARNLVDADAFEPGLALGTTPRSADLQHNVVFRARGHETEPDARPVVRAADRFRVHVPRHGSHRERRSHRDRRTPGVAHFQLLRPHIAAHLVALPDRQLHGRRRDIRVRGFQRLQHDGFVVVMLDGGIGKADAAYDRPVLRGFRRAVKDRRSGKKRQPASARPRSGLLGAYPYQTTARAPSQAMRIYQPTFPGMPRNSAFAGR